MYTHKPSKHQTKAGHEGHDIFPVFLLLLLLLFLQNVAVKSVLTSMTRIDLIVSFNMYILLWLFHPQLASDFRFEALCWSFSVCMCIVKVLFFSAFQCFDLLRFLGCNKCLQKGKLLPKRHQWALKSADGGRPLHRVMVSVDVTHTSADKLSSEKTTVLLQARFYFFSLIINTAAGRLYVHSTDMQNIPVGLNSILIVTCL